MGTLYVVSTPIGNLDDLSPRAARVLREVALVAAEDTRVVRKLLSHIDAHPKVVSYHEHSSPAALRRVTSALERGDAALVSDAGSPSISDPGAALVAAAAAAGHAVLAVPGASAVTAALAVSGIAGDRFTFIGFLPRKRGDRLRELRAAAVRAETTVCFEAPHRLRSALADLSNVLGNRSVAVCRELTKLYEETFRGTAGEALDYFGEPRGEFSIVIEGAPDATHEVSDREIGEALDMASSAGLAGRSLIDEATAATGAPRRRVYRIAVSRGGS